MTDLLFQTDRYLRELNVTVTEVMAMALSCIEAYFTPVVASRPMPAFWIGNGETR